MIASVASSLLLAPLPAAAQSSNELIAESLFEEGKTLLEAGDTREACAKLEESQRLDPGGGTLLLLGICRMREGRTATAWTTLKTALSMARQAGRQDRVTLATQAMQELSPRLSRLSLVFERDVGAGIVLELDGVPISRAAWSTTFMLDPGDHVLMVSGSGMAPLSAQIAVQEGESLSLAVPLPSEDAVRRPEAPAQTEPQRSLLEVPRPAALPAEQSATSDAWLRAGPWLLGSVGVATLGAAALLQIRALDRNDEATDQLAAADAVESTEAAKDLQNAAVITVVSGALLLGGGITWAILRADTAQGTNAGGDLSLRVGLDRFELSSTF